jgi:uncharacterized integral membrane protein (TIGR00697 family)
VGDFFASLPLGNEILWAAMLAANFGGITLAYRFFGRVGLFIWIPIAAIVANIQVLKTIELFGLTATLGNIVYATSFLATDILSENYSPGEARKAVFIGFFSLIVLTLLMNLAILFEPHREDFAQESLALIFGFMPRIALASLTAYGLSQFHDVRAYEYWRRKKPGDRALWIRNNLSTLVSQGIDTLVFTFMAFWGVYPLGDFMEILLTTYLLKGLVALLDTPFIYLAKHFHRTGKVREA